jgi:hypothetical protein
MQIKQARFEILYKTEHEIVLIFFPRINKLTRFIPQSQLKIQIKNKK